jgi:hypothetical protein
VSDDEGDLLQSALASVSRTVTGILVFTVSRVVVGRILSDVYATALRLVTHHRQREQPAFDLAWTIRVEVSGREFVPRRLVRVTESIRLTTHLSSHSGDWQIVELPHLHSLVFHPHRNVILSVVEHVSGAEVV